MQTSKVVYHGNVLIDLTNDTVTSNTMLEGVTAHASNGDSIIGTVVVQKWYSGSTDPSSGLGNDGDIYIKV